MPNGKIHSFVGTTSAAAVAAAKCGDLPDSGQIAYCLSAAIAGYCSASLPDVLEPAAHSHHRDFYHSVAAGAAVVMASIYLAHTSGAEMRGSAARLRAERWALPLDDPRRLGLWLREHAIYAILGGALGTSVAYTAHIAADMATPRGVPLVMRHRS